MESRRRGEKRRRKHTQLTLTHSHSLSQRIKSTCVSLFFLLRESKDKCCWQAALESKAQGNDCLVHGDPAMLGSSIGSHCLTPALEVRLQEPARESDGRFFLSISRLPSTVLRFLFLAFAPMNQRRGRKE